MTLSGMQNAIQVTVNGEPYSVAPDLNVQSLLALLNLPDDRVAVELNRTLVRKRDWAQTAIPPSAHIEVVEFVGGG